MSSSDIPKYSDSSSVSSSARSPVRGASTVAIRAAHSLSEYNARPLKRPVPATRSVVIGNLPYRDAGSQDAQVPVPSQEIRPQDPGDRRNFRQRAPAAAEHRRANGVRAFRSVDAISRIGQRMAHDPSDRTPVRIVEGDDAADPQQAVDEVELHHHLIERVPPVHEREVEDHALVQELWQHHLRALFPKVDERREPGLVDVLRADTAPLTALEWVDDDVSRRPLR